MPNYFLISLSNEENLKLCMEYKLAGFTNSINGFWTFTDIDEGDYISFLYAARVKNLYKVVKKVAYMNAENLPPWSPITFRESGKTYYFPFRLILKQERILDEPMVRPEFSYIAENLLLRGGYRKTHFQADAITFYNVSNMGVSYQGENNVLTIDGKTFEPKIVFQKKKEKIPESFCFRELILQSLIKKKIRDTIFRKVMEYFNLNYDIADFEFLSEKALPEGYVDIFAKLRHPVGSNKYILIEVKAGKVQNKDIEQLRRYINELKSETVAGLLIAQNFPKNIKNCINESIIPVKYFFDGVDREGEYSYSQLLEKLRLEIIN